MPASGPLSDSYFKMTTSDRLLMERAKDHSYTYYLFDVSDTSPGKDEVEFIRSRIDNMAILNVGGGKSLQDLLSQDEQSPGKFSPKAVVNVDPFIGNEDIKMNQRGFYTSLSASAASPSLEKDLENNACPNQYDEIWSVYSCPFYLTTPAEIHDFFGNMKKLLRKGSILRIFPLSICVAPEGIYSKKIEERKNSIKQAIEAIVTSGEYETYIESGSDGNLLLIRKN